MTFENFLDVLLVASNIDDIPFDYANLAFEECCEKFENKIYCGDVHETKIDLKYDWGVKRPVLSPEYESILDSINTLFYIIRDTDNIIIVEDTYVQIQILINKHFSQDPTLHHMLTLKCETLFVNKINFLNGFLNYQYNTLPFIQNNPHFIPLSLDEIREENFKDILSNLNDDYLDGLNKPNNSHSLEWYK